MIANVQERKTRVHALTSRRGLAGWPGRVALRGRHVAELTFRFRRAIASQIHGHERLYRAVRLRLEARDLRRRLATIHGRLDSVDGRMQAAIRRQHDRAQSALGVLASRLETLSPLAVLSRGYAVCWNADRTAIIRDAASLAGGDEVRVTLHNGEVTCEVLNVDSPRANLEP
jgi:exodeoxyribonuclease VII large subunit